MKTALEEISTVKKKLNVEIEASEVDKKLSQAYKELAKMAKIPGFRPGKAPRAILERHYGPRVTEQVQRELISETFPKAVENTQAFPVSTPLFEKEGLKKGEIFRYSALIEVRPQFELDGYLGIEVEKEALSVSEEDVTRRLKEIRRAYGTLNSIQEERPIRKGDYVVLDYQGFEKGEPIEGVQGENFLLNIGSGDFHPDFESGIIGLRKGEETQIHVGFAEDYYQDKLAGKAVDFTVQILDIKEMELPDLNDEFACSLNAGFHTLEELREKLRENINFEEEKRIDRELKQRLIKKISDSVDVEVPESLVKAQRDSTLEKIKQNLSRSGSNLEKAGLSEQKLMEDLRPAAEGRVKEKLIIGKIAEQQQITVDEDDVKDGFDRLARNTGQDAEALRKHYEANNLLDSLREDLLEEKTLNYLVDHANIKEVTKEDLAKENASEEKERM